MRETFISVANLYPCTLGRFFQFLFFYINIKQVADTVQKANSGHPGAPMGLAPAAFLLWTHVCVGGSRSVAWNITSTTTTTMTMTTSIKMIE